VPDKQPGEEVDNATSVGVMPASTPAVPRRPDNLLQFRLGRLLILLDSLPDLSSAKPLHLERLGYYDFFSDSPFLVLDPDDSVRKILLLAGFSERSLSYHSAAQRFTNRRARLQHDLSLLTARKLVGVVAEGRHITFSLTEEGRALAGKLKTFYAEGFRTSAEVVIRKLNRLSDKALTERAREWLRAEPFLIEIFEPVEETA
jgi:ABC-3C biological conflict system middle component